MADTDLVQPMAGAPTPPASPDTVTPGNEVPAPAAPTLPHDLLKVPAMQALVAGSPPAVSANLKGAEDREDIKLFRKNKDLMQRAGFGFYRSLSGHQGVIFNALHIHPADLQAADKAGKLTLIAPPLDVVNHAVGKSGASNPVLSRSAVPNGPAMPSPQAPPQAGATLAPGASPAAGVTGIPPAPHSVQRGLARARLAALNPGSPTSGPSPGAGRLLNSIMKPVV
jgi:hypothetical protein